MTLRSHFHRRLGLVALVALASAVLAIPAQARPERLRWTHPTPGEVQNFEAFARAPDGSSEQFFSLSVPTPNLGVYEATIEVGDGDKLISLRAIRLDNVASAWTPPQTRVDDAVGPVIPVGGGTPLSPTPGAAQRFDFAGDAVGASVTGWVDTQPNYSLLTDDSLFGVTELDSNRVLFTASTGDNIHSHATGLDNIWSDYELRGRMAINHADASIGVTAYSLYRNSDSYYRLGRSAGGEFVLEGRPALSCSGTSTGITPTPGAWYRFEFHVQDQGASNHITVKIWDQTTTEPPSLQVDCVDSSTQRPRDGTIGVWSAGAGEKYWDDLEVILGDGGATTTPPDPPVLLFIVPAEP
ncbi:MAG: hypothetical protein CL908_24900 [Deltaproteobacteria bacterium]|nr:hypothetical protein [Deltaproteobacteria bacterium]